LASGRNGTPYVGATSDFAQRATEHRAGALAGFTKRYGCKLLVWMEPTERMDEAIACEKQIKSGSRRDKLALIERDNPFGSDLYETLKA
jgi:putative endonuclease